MESKPIMENEMTTNQKITRQQAVELIKAQGQKTFTVVFIKKCGELRTMNARFGVRKHFKTPDGSGRKYNPKDYNLVCVFDMQKQQYRSIALDTIQSVTAEGQTYEVTE